MKKLIICALFAWWFVVASGHRQGSSVEVIGPFNTRGECEDKITWLNKVQIDVRNFHIIDFSSCWEAKEDSK